MSKLDKLLKDVHVEWKTLGDDDFVEIANSGRKPVKASLRITGEIPYYGANNIQDYVEGFTHDGKYILIAEDGSKSLESYSIQYAVGKFWANNHIHVIRGKNEITTKFLYYYLQIVNFIPFLSGGGRAKLTKGKLLNIPIPIPCPETPEKSLKIQKEIVSVLDAFTELTTELTTELSARNEQYTYYREKLFTFDEKEVEHLPMGDENVGEFIRGKRFVKTDMFSEGVPCIHYGEMYTHYGTWADKTKSFVRNELVERKNLRRAENGDVVIVAAGETIEDIGQGTAWLGEEGVVIHDACFYYKSTLNPKYVAYFTRTKQFHEQIRKHIRTGKISAINAKGLGKAIIPIPSIKEQERIVNILDKFNILTNSVSEGLPKEIELRKQQYEYYRNKLLTFRKGKIEA
ncbi:restriction endonuclease subunit S [Winogradskyella sp. DF17]|uniref:Restriction endonuclease subunit S n=1 Tax=Winogradskyella pelagia TaxID=2819984 RepID=A0ABS3T1A6_9FLAO|nr:restriction endonuclease subunit S [Winogradskyella sp. DF17]MBO3116517.1 restriction endonuclease subunit S [Winogradskyella sp. DF17]